MESKTKIVPENLASSPIYDGKYSWLVISTIALNNLVCQGFLFSTIGILTAEYPKLTNADPAKATLVGSVLVGVFLFSVPICTTLIKYHGCRKVSAVGFVLTVAGYLSAAFAYKLWHLILGYSIVAGFGMSINLTVSIAIVPHHFKVRKNMAYMATGLGAGIAFATYPYLYKAIRDKHSYRETILYMLPLIMCSITAPLVFKPTLKEERPSSLKELGKTYLYCMKQFPTAFHSLNCFSWNCAHGGVAVLLFSYVAAFHTTEIAITAQSIMGAMEMVGGVVLTLALTKLKFNHYILQITCNVIAGVFCFILALTTNKIAIFISAGAIGFIHSVTVGNIACMCSHLFPTREVDYVFGIQEVPGGIGGFIGPVVGGILQKRFNMAAGFYFLGSVIMFGALLLIVAASIKSVLWTPYNNRTPAKHDSGVDEEILMPQEAT